MGDQQTFASVAWRRKGKVTRRERFLAEMDAVIPWDRLIELIQPHYPKAGRGPDLFELSFVLADDLVDARLDVTNQLVRDGFTVNL